MRAKQYELFCMADPLYYDVERPAGGDVSLDSGFSIGRRDIPAGWARSDADEWIVFRPIGSDLPHQGWKIHVSAIASNAERILETVWSYCIPRAIAFKFLRSEKALFMRNAKQAARGYSGKLVTIYPTDPAQMELVCKELDEVLGGEPGPYVLSDLRWGQGPLYVRYGAFRERRCRSASGDLVSAIEDDTGTLVPDERPPAFTVPPWIEVPECLRPHLDARNAVTVADLPYQVDRALLFSNGGGVYVGHDTRTGEQVVLKEARPHAGLTGDGADAVSRLRNEHRVLRQLAGVAGVPEVRDLVTVGDHLFLVMEHVEGKPLNKLIVQRNPGLDQAADADAYAAYTRWVIEVCGRVERIAAAIHERGIVHADIHPRNVLVTDDGAVTLVDFEGAHDVASPRRQELAAPGFGAPPGRLGVAVDDHALACLRLGLFAPLTQVVGLCPRKAGHAADLIAERFGAPEDWLDEAVRTITTDHPAADLPLPVWDAAEPEGWPATRDALVRAIVASATPDRQDRLFPGDIDQFSTGGVNLAHGAAGVLYALAVTGAGPFPDYEDWLVAHATDRPVEPRLGFYEGPHGVAYALDHLGHTDRALEIVDLCLAERWEDTGHDLRDGLAGIGLNLAHLAATTGESTLRDAAERAGEVLADRLAHLDDTSTVSGGTHPRAGLMHGWAGPALLFVRLHEATGDPAHLDHAAAALRADLRRCTTHDDGTMHVDEGWRTMPYLATGSVGIGLVLDRYLAHRRDDDLAAASAAIQGAACSWFYVEPGLFEGRAGMVYYLAARRAAGVATASDPLRHQIAGLGWHALAVGDGTAFPGDQLLRLSMDLATGTAGVLLALGAACDDRAVHLPFLAAEPISVPDPERR